MTTYLVYKGDKLIDKCSDLQEAKALASQLAYNHAKAIGHSRGGWPKLQTIETPVSVAYHPDARWCVASHWPRVAIEIESWEMENYLDRLPEQFRLSDGRQCKLSFELGLYDPKECGFTKYGSLVGINEQVFYFDSTGVEIEKPLRGNGRLLRIRTGKGGSGHFSGNDRHYQVIQL
jgi:hypothetical protein